MSIQNGFELSNRLALVILNRFQLEGCASIRTSWWPGEASHILACNWWLAWSTGRWAALATWRKVGGTGWVVLFGRRFHFEGSVIHGRTPENSLLSCVPE